MRMFAHTHYQISASYLANETAILVKAKVEMPNSESTNSHQFSPEGQIGGN